MKNSVVSVIITTRNEEHTIAACLESITHQTYPDIEIIVVDNHSADGTPRIARRYTKHVYTFGPERSAQRNFGAKKAIGTYLLFLDADMTMASQVISKCVAICNTHDAAGLVVPEMSFGIGFWARCKALERECYERVDWMEAARFYKQGAFENVGGFDEKLTGPEDFELAQRVKARYGKDSIGRIDAYISHNEGNLSLAKLLRKKYYYGRRMYRYSRLADSRHSFRKQSNILARFALFFRRPVMFIQDPVHAFGMICMKILEMAALGIGGLVGGELI